jgi:hypothetical protein
MLRGFGGKPHLLNIDHNISSSHNEFRKGIMSYYISDDEYVNNHSG